MVRRIALFIVIIIFGGALTYSYYYFREKKQPISNVITAIPSSAALIIETKKAVPVWKKLHETNVMWEELLTTESIRKINATALFFDSIRKGDQNFDLLLSQQSFYISMHMSGANTFDFLFTIGINAPLNTIEANEFINQHTKGFVKTEKTYEGTSIYTIQLNDSAKFFHYTIFKSFFLGSHSKILIEDAIRQLNSDASLLDISDFRKVMHTAGNSLDANLYLNYKVFPNVLNTFLSPDYYEQVDLISNLANWTEIDMDIKASSISLNGYTFSNDSSENYMNVFKNQRPQSIEMIDILPKNTATIIHNGYSDFKQFRKDYITYLEKNNILFDKGIKIKELNHEYGIDIENDFLSWIEHETALVLTESNEYSYENNALLILRADDIDKAELKLNFIDSIAQTKIETDIFSPILFKNQEIRKLHLNNLIKITFGTPYDIVSENFYTIIQDYVIFGNSLNSLRDIINDFQRGKTLVNDPHFNAYLNNLQDKSNLLIYSNVSRSINIYKSFVNKGIEDDLNLHQSLFEKFEGVTLQISKDKNNLYYNNIFVNYNPVYKKETSSLWEASLDTSISSSPWLVKNHYTGNLEVFVQDESNKIYLISTTGKVLWSKKLSHKINSEVHQIDALRNNKLQLLFTTDTGLFLIDRNGNHVSNFPVYLPSTSAAPFSVFDYDKNKKYRIVVPLTNGDIVNYNAKGVRVQGWKYENNGIPIASTIQHTTINGKDYLISINASGDILALNRKGKERLKLKSKLPAHNPFYIHKAKDLSKSYLLSHDSIGVIKAYLNDKMQIDTLVDLPSDFKFNYFDINNDQTKDYIITSNNELKAIDPDGNELVLSLIHI